jgi:integrase
MNFPLDSFEKSSLLARASNGTDEMTRKRRGNIERRGASTRVRIMVDGVHHRFTLPTTDKALIREFTKKKRKELVEAHARRLAGIVTGTPISALFKAFEDEDIPTLAPGAQAAYADSLAPLREYFVTELHDIAVDVVRPAHVSGYTAWRRVHRQNGAAPLSNRTVAKDWAVLHRIFEKAIIGEMREFNPANTKTRPPKSDDYNPVILTSEEYERLLKQCARRPMLALYVLVLGEAGLRANTEALRLQWEDIDLEGGFLKVVSGRDKHRTKSGRSRDVPLTPRLKAALQDHLARYRFAMYNGKRTPWVFHHEHDHHTRKAGERIKNLLHGYKGAATRAKLSPLLRQHDLRHRRVTTWLAAGGQPALVQKAMGHSDIKTTMQYTHLNRDDLRALVAGQPDGQTGTQERATGSK